MSASFCVSWLHELALFSHHFELHVCMIVCFDHILVSCQIAGLHEFAFCDLVVEDLCAWEFACEGETCRHDLEYHGKMLS